MRLPRSLTSTLTLLLITLPGAFSAPYQAHTPRQPTPNALDFLDPTLSNLYPNAAAVPPTEPCGAAVELGALAFPNARFTNALAGQLNCTHKLVFRDVPVGLTVTVLAVQLEGKARVSEGGWLERAEVGVGYFPGAGSDRTTVETDWAIDADLQRKYSGPYEGTFALTMNIYPREDDPRTTRASTSCATAEEQPKMEVSFSLSSSHSQFDDEDGAMYRSTVSNVSFGLHAGWGRCDD